jgi:hypothetical protein
MAFSSSRAQVSARIGIYVVSRGKTSKERVHVRKILVLAVFGVVGIVGVAQADKPTHPGHPAKTEPKSCAPRHEGYNAVGTLVSATLTPVAGDTGHYSGTLSVTVTRANHDAATGAETFTLTDAHVIFHPGIVATALAVGSRVGLHGKITVLPKGCATAGFTPTITVHHVDIRTATP